LGAFEKYAGGRRRLNTDFSQMIRIRNRFFDCVPHKCHIGDVLFGTGE
jgi:hypothetical protein